MRLIDKILYLLLGMLLACSEPGRPLERTDIPPALDTAFMDLSVSPRDDFYQFANGGWLNKTQIPEDEGKWGGFGELAKKTDSAVLEMLKAAAKASSYEEGSAQRKAIDLFSIGMDSARAASLGAQAVRGWLAKIEAASSPASTMHVVAELKGSGYPPFFGLSVFPNLNDSQKNALYLTAEGLGLPNRDYYTKKDERSKEIRQLYQVHIARMLELASAYGDADQMAEQVISIEHQLAQASLTPIEARDIPALNNPMTINDLTELAPNVVWQEFFINAGIDASLIDTLIVTEPAFVARISDILVSSTIDEVKSYLKWHVIHKAAPFLHNESVEADFDFFGKVILGKQQLAPRSERVLDAVNAAVGEAVGQMYVTKFFPEGAKVGIEQMVDNLISAFVQRLEGLEWMSEETKEEALRKLEKLTVKIGYPDQWQDYSALRIDGSGPYDSYLSNMENAWRWQFDEQMSRIGQSVDRGLWGMNPHAVNAYFNPLNNEIVFPAGILQPPFYNFSADVAVNYGGIGAVIGHEISHCFDDQGSRFDAEGNLRNWWTEEDARNFAGLTERLVDQYDDYEAFEGLHVQGALTLGENIGDLGGLHAAYDGLQLHFADKGRPGLMDGFTPEQRFFISWATIWRTKYRDEALRHQVLTNPHSPGMFRAIGPLENMRSFYEAFRIEEGDELWKPEEERIVIW